MVLQKDGTTYEYGEEQGCGQLASVRAMTQAPDGSPLILGVNADGEQRIVLIAADACATYRASPRVMPERQGAACGS